MRALCRLAYLAAPAINWALSPRLRWSLTCMFIARDHRKQGLSAQLIAGAANYAKRHKARILEAYPVDPDSPSYRHMGFVPAFERAGFVEVGREGTRRHVMHLPL